MSIWPIISKLQRDLPLFLCCTLCGLPHESLMTLRGKDMVGRRDVWTVRENQKRTFDYFVSWSDTAASHDNAQKSPGIPRNLRRRPPETPPQRAAPWRAGSSKESCRRNPYVAVSTRSREMLPQELQGKDLGPTPEALFWSSVWVYGRKTAGAVLKTVQSSVTHRISDEITKMVWPKLKKIVMPSRQVKDFSRIRTLVKMLEKGEVIQKHGLAPGPTVSFKKRGKYWMPKLNPNTRPLSLGQTCPLVRLSP
eukprot:1323673-Amorphochlora_amoeboformis.AAC.1